MSTKVSEQFASLAAKAEQQKIMLGENRVLHLRDYSFIIAENPGKNGLAGFEFFDEVAPHLLLHPDWFIAAFFEVTEGGGQGIGCHKDLRSAIGGATNE